MRRRGFLGSGARSILPPIRAGLMATLELEERAAPRAPRVFFGPKPHQARPSKHSDALVLEVRRMRQNGLSIKDIVLAMLDLGYEVSEGTVTSILTYTTRLGLEPTPGAAPYLVKNEHLPV
jgi:hypothetical protein